MRKLKDSPTHVSRAPSVESPLLYSHEEGTTTQHLGGGGRGGGREGGRERREGGKEGERGKEKRERGEVEANRGGRREEGGGEGDRERMGER